MEAHPVPQNVTNFEFHLVGDMTLKQFGYLAFGLGFAYLVFFLFASQAPFFAWPIVIISSLLGVAFAFLPIQERPLDHWVGAFFSAIFKPTKFVYKSEVVIKEDPFFKKRLNFYLSSLSSSFLPSLSWGITPPVAPVPVTPTPQVVPSEEQPKEQVKPTSEETSEKLPSAEVVKQTVDLAKEALDLRKKIVKTEDELNKIKAASAQPGAQVKNFTQDYQTVLSDLQKLNSEAAQISKQLADISKTPPASTPAIKAKSSPTISLTETANILNGIITDALGNYIEGAIIVAHDKQDSPVRALKTNKLGQFIAATPLPNGTYILTAEKDNLAFDTIQIELSGQVMQPVIVSAKKGVS